MKELFQLATSLICLLTVLNIPVRAMKVSQPGKIIVGRHNVTLKCKYDITGDREAQLFRVTIYREKPERMNEVCSATFNHTTKLFEMRGVLHCKGQPDSGSVSVTFIGMNVSDSDLYFCKVEKLQPLPYTEDTGNGSLIFIKPDVVEAKRCAQVTQATLIILALTGIFLLYSVVITYLHWPLGATACILGMKEAVDMKCELIHNSDEPATATWNGQRWETGPRQDVEKKPRGTEQ